MSKGTFNFWIIIYGVNVFTIKYNYRWHLSLTKNQLACKAPEMGRRSAVGASITAELTSRSRLKVKNIIQKRFQSRRSNKVIHRRANCNSRRAVKYMRAPSDNTPFLNRVVCWEDFNPTRFKYKMNKPPSGLPRTFSITENLNKTQRSLTETTTNSAS